MARVANPGRGSLGDVAQYGVDAHRRVADLDLALGYPAPAYNAVARTPAFGGLLMIEWAGGLPGPYGPGYKLARSSGPRASRADLDSEYHHRRAPSSHIKSRIVEPSKRRGRWANPAAECQRSGGPRQTESPASKGRVGIQLCDHH